MRNLSNILSFFSLYEIKNITAKTHPWNRSLMFIIQQKNNKKFLLKSWERIILHNLKNDVYTTKKLGEVGFNNATKYLTNIEFNYYLADQEKLWTLCEFIDGDVFNDFNPNLPQKIGKVLNELHIYLNQLNLNNSNQLFSKINELPEFIKKNNNFIKNNTQKQMVRDFLEVEMKYKINIVKKFKKSNIHGDINLGNIIFADETYIIDFEYARNDLKILEFVSLYAPSRNSRGEFNYFGKDFVKKIIHNYNYLSSPSQKVPQTEINMLDEMAALYYLIIAMENYKEENPFYHCFIEVVYQILEERFLV